MAPGIFSIREKSYRFGQPATNIYYVPDSKGGGLLFDAGYAMRRSFNDFMAGFRGLAAFLKQSGKIPAAAPFSGLVTTIVLSHEHHDHASGASLLKQYFPSAKIFASRATAALLKSQSAVTKTLGELLESILMNLFYRLVRAKQAIHVDHIVQGNDDIQCGNRRFTALLAPGHAPGQVMLYEHESGILISSDLVLRIGSTWLGPPHSDYQAYQDTMESIAQLNPTLMLPAHGGAIHNPRERVLELLSFRRLREGQILKICSQSPQSEGDVAWRIYSERGIGTYLMAKGMVGLVLRHLVAVGLLRRVKKGRKVKYVTI
nr:MBL fold metallo-hydrolase [Candidatus Sigynarchaeum springense]MDO8116320.1 MBL fold metallo-hydrolase [Candidatus Sigynarchaeota archaeon]